MKPGDRVHLRPITAEEAVDIAREYRKRVHGGTLSGHVGALNFCPAHNDYEVASRDEVGDVHLRCVPCLQAGNLQMFWACPAWVAQYKPEPTWPKCDCDLTLHGCTCGAFAVEQQIKGLVQNRWTGFWERAG